MGWYVFALIDAPPRGRLGKGLTGPLVLRVVGGARVVVERRADVPPVAFGTLKRHQAVVDRLAGQAPAILPVRFGTLMDSEHLDEALSEREGDIAEAFDLVRGRVQFTWRARRSPPTQSPRGPAPASHAVKAAGRPASGTEYLVQAARAAAPVAPPKFRALETRLSPFIAGRRYQAAAATLPEAVYHLVERSNSAEYAAAATTVRATQPDLKVSGPFPPFAFAPEIL